MEFIASTQLSGASDEMTPRNLLAYAFAESFSAYLESYLDSEGALALDVLALNARYFSTLSQLGFDRQNIALTRSHKLSWLRQAADV